MSSSPTWSSWTPSPTSSPWAAGGGEVHAHPPHRFPEEPDRSRRSSRASPHAARAWSRPRWASPRSWIPGSCSRTSRASGERNRGLMILKSRGMAHSNQFREFRLTDDGLHARGRLPRRVGRAHRGGPPGPDRGRRGGGPGPQEEIERLSRQIERKRAVLEVAG